MQGFERGSPGRRGLHLLAAAAAATVLLGGCASRGGSVPYDRTDFGRPDLETLILPASAQLIGPLDELKVTVFQVPDLSGEFRVDAQGQLVYPLIGNLQAAGKSPAELGQEIAARLDQRFLQNANVQVAVTEAAEQTITVEGEVRQPGVIPIRGATSLLKAIALGRGTTEAANASRVVVFRTIDGQRMAAAFDLQAIRQAESPDPAIYGNDIIVVAGSRSRALFRDVISVLPALGIFYAL